MISLSRNLSKVNSVECFLQLCQGLCIDWILGAKVYYLHNVLHDWPEEKALKILQNLVPVMERGYSVLLVHDTIVTECQPDPMVCSLDITMMVKYSAQERTASTWRSMSEFVGLKLSNVYSKPGNRESVMEFVLA